MQLSVLIDEFIDSMNKLPKLLVIEYILDSSYLFKVVFKIGRKTLVLVLELSSKSFLLGTFCLLHIPF